MALIKCSECGNEVSDKANACPKCGFPIQSDNTVRIAFPRGQQLFNMKCIVYDLDDNELASCKEGEIAEFEINKPTEIRVTMKSRIGSTSIIVNPGDRCRVSFKTMGIGISKVDIL